MTHPLLVKAREALDATPCQVGPILGIAFRARAQADLGQFCSCLEPELVGMDLLCGACLLNNKDQERRRVVEMVRAHDFVDNGMGLRMCKVCSMWDTDSRHHGVNAVGRCSWGEEVRPCAKVPTPNVKQ